MSTEQPLIDQDANLYVHAAMLEGDDDWFLYIPGVTAEQADWIALANPAVVKRLLDRVHTAEARAEKAEQERDASVTRAEDLTRDDVVQLIADGPKLTVTEARVAHGTNDNPCVGLMFTGRADWLYLPLGTFVKVDTAHIPGG